MKAMALMLARQRHEASPTAGGSYQFLAEQGWNAMFALIPRQRLSHASYASPGNQFLCDPAVTTELRQRALTGQLTPLDQAEHLIPDAAAAASRTGLWDSFVRERSIAISQREEQFVDAILQRHPIVK